MVELFPSGPKSPRLYREKLCRTKAFVPVERPGTSVPLLTPAVEVAALEEDRVMLGAQHLPPPNRNQHRDWGGTSKPHQFEENHYYLWDIQKWKLEKEHRCDMLSSFLCLWQWLSIFSVASIVLVVATLQSHVSDAGLTQWLWICVTAAWKSHSS